MLSDKRNGTPELGYVLSVHARVLVMFQSHLVQVAKFREIVCKSDLIIQGLKCGKNLLLSRVIFFTLPL